jgi:hypothetical protein
MRVGVRICDAFEFRFVRIARQTDITAKLFYLRLASHRLYSAAS